MPLDKNLTGEQIQQVLDLFLYKAIEPVVLNTDIFDSQVSYILGLISSNRKRKPSSLPREKIIDLLCIYLATEDRSEKFEVLRRARIERFFLHIFLSKLLKEFEGFMQLYRQMMLSSKSQIAPIKAKLDEMADRVGCTRMGLYRIMNLSVPYLNSFYRCRSLVLDHYLKLASRQANAYIQSGKGNFDYLDVRQSILKSILLALDKYDSSKGALTSYINWWIFNAQTCSISEHEYGVAYTIPQTQRRRIAQKDSNVVNYSVSMDDLSKDDDKKDLHSVISGQNNVDKAFEKNEEIETICYLAKCMDTRGVARLALDIGEFFSISERRSMALQTKSELTKL